MPKKNKRLNDKFEEQPANEALQPETSTSSQSEGSLAATTAPTIETAPLLPETNQNDTTDKGEYAISYPDTPLTEQAEVSPISQAVDEPAGQRESEPATAVQPSTIRKLRIRLRPLIVGLVLVLAAAGGWWYYNRSQSLADTNQNQTIVSRVAQLVELPANETPGVSTVVDTTKVNQPFLAKAKTGDTVLLYFEEGQAIVYRPSTNKIISMGPITEPSPRVFVRSGTGAAVDEALVATIRQSDKFVITSQDRSNRKDYKQTVVVDVAGNRPEIARQLADLLKVQVVTMPEGESRPDADLLVITGARTR